MIMIYRVRETMNRIDAFDRKQLCKAFKIFYPHTITNDKLYKITNKQPMKETIQAKTGELPRLLSQKRRHTTNHN